MQLIDDLIARAASADQAAGELAQHQFDVTARQKAYDQLQQLFDHAAADGKLTEEEVTELMDRFRAAGLSTTALESVFADLKEMDTAGGVDVSASLRTQIANELSQARLDSDDDPLFHFKAQKLTAEYQQAFDLAARVSKSEHDIYMTAIKHLVA